ncbi:MAG: dihydrolipoamide acetyltransferase family protein [Acidobacteriota bacterium]
MTQEFKLEDPGEGIHEAEILNVFVSEGQTVSEGDPVLEIETDKASIEIPSPFDGTVESIKVQDGDQVRVGDVMMTYRLAEEAKAGGDAKEPGEKRAAGPAGETRRPQSVSENGELRASEPEEDRPVPASPATRRLARERGIDLHDISGSGPRGRVTSRDVLQQATGEGPGTEPRRHERERERKGHALSTEATGLPDFSRWGEVEIVPLRSIRRSTARHMSIAWREIPHVMHQDSVDVTELEKLRRHQRERVEREGGKLTLTVLVAKAVVQSLQEFPRFNSSIDPEGGRIILKRYYHIGIAVAAESGLFVPVLRNVDQKSIIEVAVELSELVRRARSGDLRRDEMQGGTFTITNAGAIGGTSFSPLVNFPEVAILGLSRARLEPVVEGDLENPRIVARLMLPLQLAFDHRVNDGADSGRFMNHLKGLLSNPESLMMAL